jgi:hypothetical protein
MTGKTKKPARKLSTKRKTVRKQPPLGEAEVDRVAGGLDTGACLERVSHKCELY